MSGKPILAARRGEESHLEGSEVFLLNLEVPYFQFVSLLEIWWVALNVTVT